MNDFEKTDCELENSKDWKLSVNADRVLVECIRESEDSKVSGWTLLSSAILNGGFKSCGTSLQILNAKVPSDYDGLDPEPEELLRQMAAKEASQNQTKDEPNKKHDRTTIGLLTAASMKTMRVVSESATGTCGQICKVDVIVTAGISNARVAGADTDVFYLVLEDKMKKKQGTINTIILMNMPLDESPALVEVYALATEAKCRAMADLGIMCAKNPAQLATGTGTDTTALICPTPTDGEPTIKFAQKHTLVGELVGKAVYQATKEAVESNLVHYAGRWPFPSLVYRLRCYRLQLVRALKQGHCPQIPSRPKQPIPKPSGCVLLVGGLALLCVGAIHLFQQDEGYCPSEALPSILPQKSIHALVAVYIMDRFLGSLMMPLIIHPVMKVGKVITFLKDKVPEHCFEATHPVQGFLAGILLWVATLTISVGTAWLVLIAPRFFVIRLPILIRQQSDSLTCENMGDTTQLLLAALEFIVHVFILRGSLSLQLLCNVGNQMAYFLERGQLQRARCQLSWLCSRDPSDLRADELAGGTLESLSENLSDSVTSPLFFYVLFGPLGAFAFRVVNTLDSRVGYRGRCEWVGKFSARIDDVLNLVSARLTALILVLAAAMCYPNQAASLISKGLSVAWRDCSQCDSPNAGWPMACLAGILDVKLEKRGQYSLNGPPNKGNGKAPNYKDIRRGHLITQVAGLFLFCLAISASLLLG